MTDSDRDLDELRSRIGDIDRELLGLVSRRIELARGIGELKQRLGRPTRDFAQERVVLERAKQAGDAVGLPPGLAQELMLAMIRRAVAAQEQQALVGAQEQQALVGAQEQQALVGAQEQQALVGAQSGLGKRALVIGGAGKMGRWFVRFLGSLGFDVAIADPEPTTAEVEQFADWRDAGSAHEVVVLATPLVVANGILDAMSARPPEGLVFDIGSLKSPLREGLTKLLDSGGRVTSIHPMFGPDTVVLSGRHVIFVDLGHAEATRAARELFERTAVVQVQMSLDDHDRQIAYVLGLSHALNIAFFTALAESGEVAGSLREMSSTTFDDQLEVASRVAWESPDLYFEIQSLNDYGTESLSALASAVERLRSCVGSGDRAGFTALMERGREYLAARTMVE